MNQSIKHFNISSWSFIHRRKQEWGRYGQWKVHRLLLPSLHSQRPRNVRVVVRLSTGRITTNQLPMISGVRKTNGTSRRLCRNETKVTYRADVWCWDLEQAGKWMKMLVTEWWQTNRSAISSLMVQLKISELCHHYPENFLVESTDHWACCISNFLLWDNPKIRWIPFSAR